MKADRLLFIQGGKCFYCRKQLLPEHATVDHIIPISKGGKNDISNLVACCKDINHLFSDLSPKSKMETVFNWGKNIKCPNK